MRAPARLAFGVFISSLEPNQLSRGTCVVSISGISSTVNKLEARVAKKAAKMASIWTILTEKSLIRKEW